METQEQASSEVQPVETPPVEPQKTRRERMAELLEQQSPVENADEPVMDEPTDEPSPPEEKPEVLDRSWAALDRKDREVLAKQQQLKKEREELKELAAVRDALSKGDKQAALAALGVEPKALAAEFWGDERTPEEKAAAEADGWKQQVQSEIARLKEQNDRLLTERNREKAYAALRTAVSDVKDAEVVSLMVEDQGDAFLDEIFRQAQAEREQYGETPDLSDLLKRSEDAYTEQYLEAFKKLARVPKIAQGMKGILSGKNPTEAPKQSSPPKRQARTITNDLAGEPAISNPKPQTRTERRKRAMSILEHGIGEEK